MAREDMVRRDMVRVEGLTVIFGAGTPNPVRALDGVSLALAPGEFVVVIGANGSGKSTLLNAIAGNAAPAAGGITIGGVDVTRLGAHRRAAWLGRVFQNPTAGTAPSMTVAENLRLASLRGGARRLRVGLNAAARRRLRDEAATLGMGLEDRMETPIGLLSGGQRQALTLLMATLGTPALLLLDEHTAALDPASAEQVMLLTSDVIARQRLTALMVTHDMEEALRFGDRLVMMRSGRVVLDVAGDEKRALTPAALLERFNELRREAAV